MLQEQPREKPDYHGGDRVALEFYGKFQIAVGTLITERRPHRTVRAAFPHTAPTLGV